MRRLLEKKLLLAALAASMMLTACPGGGGNTDAGTDAGMPDAGTDGGSTCQYPNTTWAQLLNAPVAAGVTVIHKTPMNPPYDGGTP